MKSLYKEISIQTSKQFEVQDITEKVSELVGRSGIKNGVVVVQSPHTTGSVRLNHFEPLLLQDMLKAIYRLVPVDSSYSHDLFEIRKEVNPDERSNGHSHIKSFLLGSSESVILSDGKLMLGAKQSVLFIEFDGGRKRNIQIMVMGE